VRGNARGIVHHSDQGVQYASKHYVRRAQQAGLEMSMSRRGRPNDNAQMESFFATLKAEEIQLTEYRDLDEARSRISQFIGQVYNGERLHSALGYLPPLEFESAQRSTPVMRSGADSNSVSAGDYVSRGRAQSQPSPEETSSTCPIPLT